MTTEEVEVEVEVEEGMKADADADADATTIRGMATDETDVSAKAAAISTDAKADSIAEEMNTEAGAAVVDGMNVDRGTMIATTETSGANSEADLVKATAGTTPTKEEEDVEVLIADKTNTEEAADETDADRGTTIATTETSGANSEADLVKATTVAPRFATGMDLATGIAALAVETGTTTGTTTQPVVNAAVNAHRTITRDSVVRVENLVDPLMIAAIPISIAIATTKVSDAGLTIPLDDAIPVSPIPTLPVVPGDAVNGTTAGIPIGSRHLMTFACGETRIVVGIKTFHAFTQKQTCCCNKKVHE